MNREDLEQFQRLSSSPIRTEERENALEAWEAYKHSRQVAFWRGRPSGEGREGGAKQGVWTKGDYVRCLTAPVIDLRGATLTDVCVGYADLRGARLDNVTFSHDVLPWTALKGARLEAASLRHAEMPEARLMDSDLRGADLSGANLVGADLSGANLAGAMLGGTRLGRANLEGANLVGARIEGCELDGARVYGVAAWDLKGEPKSSKDLVVTPETLPTITADDIRVAQFIYLLVNNPGIRNILDTVTRKVVLLLGRFTPERKAVLDALRDDLRTRNFVPVMFDFEPSANLDITETVTLLARMARFIIADLTEPSSLPQELQAVAPHVAVPIRLIIQQGHEPYAMSRDLRKYHWVIKPYEYPDIQGLLANLRTHVVEIAEAKRREIADNREDDGN